MLDFALKNKIKQSKTMFKQTQALFKTQILPILCSSRNKAAVMNLKMTRDCAGTFTKKKSYKKNNHKEKKTGKFCKRLNLFIPRQRWL